MYHGLRPEHLYLFFAYINKKKLNFAGIYDKRKKYIVMEPPFQGYKQIHLYLITF